MTAARFLLAGLLLLCGAGAAAGAPKETHGADPCSPQVRDPQKLAEAGLAMYRAAAALHDPALRVKEYERALRCYRAAMDSSKGQAAKLYHPLGLVLEKLDRPVEAAEAFKLFLERVPEGERHVGVTKQIDDKLAALRRQVAELDIETVPGLEVRVDQRLVGKAPLGRLVVVTPGSHAIVVGDPATGTAGADVRVDAGQVRQVDLTGWRARSSIPELVEQDKAQERARPHGSLVLGSNRSGALLRIDDRPVGQTPLPELTLAPGPHTIVARDGGQVLTRQVKLAAGERLALDLHFPVKPWVWAVTGVAAAAVLGTAIGVGAYYGSTSPVPDAVVGGWH